MKAFINHHLFAQTTLDSGALTMLGAVIHNFAEAGIYHGTVFRGTETIARFQLMVDSESPAMQADIDLATLKTPPECCCGEPGSEQLFSVNPKGYAVFFVSRGAGGYAVHVARVPAEGEKEQQSRKMAALAFDSRELKEGDLFAATLIRPGTYAVTNKNAKATGQITVAYPKAGKTPYRPPEPVYVESTAEAFRPAKIAVEASQGQVYRVKVPSRIKIELVKPDDGPGIAPVHTIAGWKKPGRPMRRATKSNS
jgi:hypothetical protein